MKTTILFVFAACAAASSYANADPNAELSSTATVGQHTATFWFPIENAYRSWVWGDGFSGGRQYACMVKTTLKGKEYQFGYTKWNPPPNKEWPESKGEGSLRSLLQRGQVAIWENGRALSDARGISVSPEGNGVAIQLSEPEYLQAFLAEKPKQIVLETVGFSSERTKVTVEVSYQDSPSAPKLPPKAKALVTEYMQKPDNKVFIIAIDPNGRFANGYAFGKESLKEAAQIALKQCDKERRKKGMETRPIIYAMNNKVVYEEMYEKAWPKIKDNVTKE